MSVKLRWLVAILGLLMATSAALPPSAFAQVYPGTTPYFHYELQLIHHEGEWEASDLKALNQDSHVLGRCRFPGATRYRVFLWANGATQYLDEVPTVNESGVLLAQFKDFGRPGDPAPTGGEFFYSTAEDMNDAGQIVGYGFYYPEGYPLEDRIYMAYRWTPPTGEGLFALLERLDLPVEDWQRTSDNKLLINNSGDMAGAFIPLEGDYGVFLYTAEDGYVCRGMGTVNYLTRLALRDRFQDNDGQSCIQLVGGSYGFGGGINNGSRAVRYTARIGDADNFSFEDLGTLNSDGSGSAGAWGINDLGEIAGISTLKTLIKNKTYNSEPAFRYTDEEGMVNLGTLTTENSASAHGINSFGHIVGGSDGHPVFLYRDDCGMLNLTERITMTDELSSLLTLGRLTPYWINDSGDIAGPWYPSAYYNVTPKAFLLRWVPDQVATCVSTDTPKAIVDASRKAPGTTTSTISVANTGMTVDSVLLDLRITHENPSQLSAELRSPGGTVVLFNQGEYQEALHAESTISLPSPVAADGTWSLVIKDYVRGSTGTLNSWAIGIDLAAE